MREPDAKTRLDLVRQYGNFTLAYSTAVQPGLRYFADDRGYIAYVRHMGVVLALADPVCAPEDREELIEQFLQKFSKATFWQISHDTALCLATRGYYVNEFGPDTHIDLQNFTLSGADKKNLRLAVNRLNRHYQVVDGDISSFSTAEINAVSQAWRSTRTVARREVRFLNRPLTLAEEADVRRFFAVDKDKQVVAFLFCDPVYQGGRIIGYSTAFKRRHPQADSKIEQGLTSHAIETFKNEGLSHLYLGLAPCADLRDDEFRYNPLLRWEYQLIYNNTWFNKYVYALKGHARFKSTFRGERVPTYFASRKFFNLYNNIAHLRYAGVL